MSRIALLLLALCLTMGTIGCKEETPAPAPAPTDTDADGAKDAADEAPADPAAK
jgi:hypothetical protein